LVLIAHRLVKIRETKTEDSANSKHNPETSSLLQSHKATNELKDGERCMKARAALVCREVS